MSTGCTGITISAFAHLCIQRQQENIAADVLHGLDICLRVAMCNAYKSLVKLAINVDMCVNTMKVQCLE